MRSKAYLRWVSEQPCSKCGAPGPVEAHHIKHVGHFSGVGMKASDLLTCPLCHECHMELHATPDLWPDQMVYILRTIEKAEKEGVIREA